MSDEGEIDVESDDVADVGDISGGALSPKGLGGVPVDKRAHHNALERKRRDHIKDSFTGLRDSIPSLVGEKVSRAHVLNKATDYIRQMQKNSSNRNLEIEELTRKNEILEEQLSALEQAKLLGNLDNPEELLASITGKVHQRQIIRQQQAAAVKTVGKVQLEQEVPKDKAPPTELSPSINNMLASNLRTTQSLLSALAKIPNNTTSSAQVRNLAAKVLASPLRPTGASVPPRGFVTATTVPGCGAPGLVKVTPIQATPPTNALANNLATNSIPSSVATPSINTATPTVDINALNAVLAGLANNVTGNNSVMDLVSMSSVAERREEEAANGDDPPNKRFKSDPES